MAVNESGTITLRLLAQDLASGNVGKFIGNIDRLAKQGGLMGSVMQGVGQSFGQMLNPVALVAKGIGMVTDFMGDSINAASAQAEALSKVTVVFGDQADEIEKWAGTAADSMGMTTTAALEAAGTLGNLFDALGLAEDKSSEMSKAITQLAADLGSFNNVASEEAMSALQSGLLGETEPMRRFGANLSAARVEAYALAKGMAATSKGITDAIKVQARYELILEDTKNAQGDYARTSDGLANSTKSLNARFGDMTVKLGQLVQGPANLFVGFLDDVLTRLAPSGASSLPPRIQLLIDKFEELDEVASTAGGSSSRVRVTLEDAAASLEEVAEINRLGGNFQTAKWISMLGPQFVQIANNVGVTTQNLASLAFEATKAGLSFEEFRSSAFAAVNDTEDATTSMVDAWTLGTKYMGTAAVETGQTIRKSLVGPVRRTVSQMLATMDSVKEPWKEGWANLAAWAKDPFSPAKFENYISGRARAASRKARESFGAERRRWREIARTYRWIAKQEWIDPMTADVEAIMIGLRTASRMTAGAARTTINGTDWQLPGNNASGTDSWRGGWTWVGERGRELVNLPRGTQIKSNPESEQMARGGNVTVNVILNGLTVAPSEAQMQPLMRTLVPAIRREMNRAGG